MSTAGGTIKCFELMRETRLTSLISAPDVWAILGSFELLTVNAEAAGRNASPVSQFDDKYQDGA